ncbi:cytochrome c oxidase subunit II [Herbaspirillum sp. GCM10030257]|uniref:cytochrome c oxidase subunit II n=1 Tax=Herbaspirillum sp. GCM10030257 TaxID=3273393 RepID=UPI003620B656
MSVLFSFLLLCLTPSLAWGEMQSAFEPKGNNAAEIADIMWVLFVGGSLIFVAVIILAGIALFGTNAQRHVLARQELIIGGGIVFPVVTLSALLVYSFASGAIHIGRNAAPQERIEVIGELWWWRVRYLDSRGNPLFETANELRIPVGRAIEVLLKSGDVIHSFWVPNLAGKIDMIPGHVNRLQLHAAAPGVYRGQCAEYCGAQHAKMAFYVIAQEQTQYDAWLSLQAQPALEPADPFLLHGRQLFLDNRCGQCHAVRGTQAAGQIGPELTHVGGRHAIAAGTLPNNSGTIAGWISGSQQIKPGNRMPSFNQFSGEELRALAAYLESLQ